MINLKNFLPNRQDIIRLSRAYSQYDKHYVKPIYEKSTLDEICANKELDKYKNISVKAAQDSERYSVFYDVALSKFTNYIMREGKKKLARQQLEMTLRRIKEIQVAKYNREVDPEVKSKIVLDPIRIFKQAVYNCQQLMKLAPIRRGGLVYQVPVPIREEEACFRAMRALVESSKDKEGTTKFYIQLSNELLDAFENRGRVIKQKHELHKTCEANRAYAHYRWG